jgi:class 3 adenylate cyclase
MRCSSCGFENPGGRKFCSECGTVLPRGCPTETSARLDPEELRELEADYSRVMTEAIGRFDGLVAKHLRNGLMAYFGWPEAHDNDAERAARAGLAIVDAVGALNQRDGQGGRPRLSARVGIDSGTVVIGQGGSSDS